MTDWQVWWQIDRSNGALPWPLATLALAIDNLFGWILSPFPLRSLLKTPSTSSFSPVFFFPSSFFRSPFSPSAFFSLPPFSPFSFSPSAFFPFRLFIPSSFFRFFFPPLPSFSPIFDELKLKLNNVSVSFCQCMLHKFTASMDDSSMFSLQVLSAGHLCYPV